MQPASRIFDRVLGREEIGVCVPPERIESVSDAERWIIEHDARIDVFWQIQHAWNKKIDEKFEDLKLRTALAERKMIALTAFAAGLGAAASQVISFLIRGG